MRTPWKLQNLGRWAGLLALSVLVTVLVFLGGIVLLAWQTGERQASSLGALRDVSQALCAGPGWPAPAAAVPPGTAGAG